MFNVFHKKITFHIHIWRTSDYDKQPIQTVDIITLPRQIIEVSFKQRK